MMALEFVLGFLIVSIYGIGIGVTKVLIDNDSETEDSIVWAVVWPLTAVVVLAIAVVIMPGVWVHDKIRGRR